MGVLERKQREKSDRKNAIIDAAEAVFFSKGIANASMDEVARKADLSKGTLYLYFKNKNALYRAILRKAYTFLMEDLNQVASLNHASGLEKVLALSNQYFNFSIKQPGYFEAILHYENDVIDLKEREEESVKSIIAGNQVLAVLTSAIQAGIDDKSIQAEVNPLHVSLVLWGQATGLLQIVKSKGRIINHYFKVSENELIDSYLQLLKSSLEK